LPTSLQDALEALESDKEFLKPAFSDDFLDMYSEVKKDEYLSVASVPSPREFYMYGNI
jgi:glutamine synthetase